MATFTVTTLDDENDYGAPINIGTILFPIIIPNVTGTSLREAIKLANDNPGEDTIVFADDLSGVIQLTNGEITISDEVTIIGGGDITITGDADGDDLGADGALASSSDYITDVALSGAGLLDDNSRIFNATADLTLDGLTLTGGRTTGDREKGGAVYSDAALTIVDSTISGNNTAGDTAAGGGVFSYGAITVTNSTISGNSTAGDAAAGGGARAYDVLTVTNSTISGNSTAGAFAKGGGATSAAGLTVTNSTISGNSTAGDFAEGGGVFSNGAITLTNSIVLGNIAVNSDDNELAEYIDFLSSNDGLIAVTGQNIIGADSDAFDTSQTTGSGSAINASAASVFAETEDNNGVQAGVLADNGGGVQTIALKAASFNPALDAAGVGAPSVDARGEAVFLQALVSNGGFRDLGAYELTKTVESSRLTVTTTDDVVDGADGQTSLREAVAFANLKDGADTITFDLDANDPRLIRLTEGELVITDELTVDGGGLVTITGDAGADDVTLAGGITDVAASGADLLDDNSRIFNASADLTLDGLMLTGGRTTGDRENGGAVKSENALTIVDSTISGNSTTGYRSKGGGAYSQSALTVTNSTISGNSTSGDYARGGGVYSDSILAITDSTISGNSTAGEDALGGGAHSFGDLTVTNSTISGNNTAGDDASGGGVSSFNAVTITNSTISGNSTAGNGSDGGGASSRALGALIVTNSIVLGNIAKNANGDELFESFSEFSSGSQDGLIAVTGQNIIGANSTAFDVVNQTTGSGSVINANAADVFSDTVDNNGVLAGVLFGNGGPVETIRLRASSDNPALDAATITGTDARGEARGVDLAGVANGGTSDLGAFELQLDEDVTAPSITSNTAISVGEGLSSALSSAPVTAEDIQAVTFSIFTGPDEGQDGDKIRIDPTTGVLSFLSEPDFENPSDADGDNVFEVTVAATDAGGQFTTRLHTIRITDINEAPVAAPSAAMGDEDTVISGALIASDVDGDALSFSVVSGPSNGSVTVSADGSFQFTPVADFNGTDSFTFRASDGALSDTATATITVNPVDDPGEPVDPVDPVEPDDPVNPVDPVDPPAPAGPTLGDDILSGTALNDTINALAGNDKVLGLAGDDLLIGGGGDDNIVGAAGDDRLRGNGGDDTLKGGGGDDNIKGNGGADVIRGNGGDDTIKAGGGDDNVKGGGGADVINGGGGADKLNGGGGDDTIAGKGGDDTLKGNGGADVFQFRTSDRNDTIADFRQGQDKIQIQNGVRTFEGLDIEQDGRDVLIGFGAGQVRVVTDNAGAFDESDFIF